MVLVKRGGLSSGKLVIRAKLAPLIDTFHDHIPSASPSVRENPAPFMLPPIGQGSIMSAGNSVEEQLPGLQPPLNNSLGSSNSYYSSNIYASKRYSTKVGGSVKQPQYQQQNNLPQNVAASHKAQQMPQQMSQQMHQQQMNSFMLNSNPGSPKNVQAAYSVKSPASVRSYQQQGGASAFMPAGNDMAQSHLAPSYRNPTKSSLSPQSMLPNNMGMDALHVIDRSDQPSHRMSPPFMYSNDAPVHYDPQQAQNLVDSPDDMSYLGGMSVGSRISRGRAESNDNRDLSGSNNNNNNNNMYQPANMRDNRAESPVNGGYSASPSLAGMSQTSLHIPDNFVQAINVQIFSVHAVEMKSAHTFASNCPSCALACGKSTVNTPVIVNAGSSASWEKINFSFSFDKKNSFRVLIVSKDITIGYCNFTREKLINGKPSQLGNVVRIFFLFIFIHFI
ncbi:hypothetical protein EON65_08940 [archaeon]|nr:MAG: hypothetical protein EON65_08940 [archaeon]